MGFRFAIRLLTALAVCSCGGSGSSALGGNDSQGGGVSGRGDTGGDTGHSAAGDASENNPGGSGPLGGAGSCAAADPCCADPKSSACLGTADATIDKIYFAQTHVLPPEDPLFKLVSSRNALLKVQVLSPTAGAAPAVSATLKLGEASLQLDLKGPSILPTSFPSDPGIVLHRYEDSFSATIPGAWVQPGLSVVVKAGLAETAVPDLRIGAPTRVILNMFDISYFKPTPGDYPTGWHAELESKWPVAATELRRVPNVVFPWVIVPPRAGLPATLVSSAADYQVQNGVPFDGEQLAASQWVGALKAAAGTSGRIALYYMNIYGANAGGQAGGFGGVGNGTSAGILHHELGHALSLPHWGDNVEYPYKGDMHGITAPASYQGTHAGPTWAFDPVRGNFLPPTVQEGASTGVPGTYKLDPMQGGGIGDQEAGYIFRHFSDYSINQMRGYLEKHVVVWSDELGSYAQWNDEEGAYTSVVPNNGVQFPVERDVSVLSVMAGVSAVTPQVDLVYPPIGPYLAGRITLFDPTVTADRTAADSIFCPADGCDVSLRVAQGGVTKTYLLPIALNPADPKAPVTTRAINLPAAAGSITRVDLLSSPDAEKVGLPASPEVLSTWQL